MKRKSLLVRAATATATLGTAFAGAVVVTSGPAQAALQETNYGFYTYAFGTSARAETVGLGSAPTAFSFLGCTRLAGKQDDEAVAKADVPTNTPALGIGAVTSHSETFKHANGDVGSTSTNKVASVLLGASNGPHLVIKGLETSATAWADKNGKFHTDGSFVLADILAATGTPLDDVLNNALSPLQALIKQILAAPGDHLDLPGIGRISLGRKTSSIQAGYAKSNTLGLRVLLYGPNSLPGGGDDISVIVGRSHARVYRNLPAGVMGGFGYAVDVNVLSGLVGVPQLAKTRLPCAGTNGQVKTGSVVGLNLFNLGALDLGVASGRVYGVQNKDGSADAWTEGRLADLSLGTGASQLVIKGVVAHAEMRKAKNGTITKSTTGTKFASITFGGKEYDIPKPGDKIEIPGLATIQFGIVENPSKNSLKVTSLRITLVPAAAADTGLVTINLGVATVHLRRV
jgi:hypothetical protein